MKVISNGFHLIELLFTLTIISITVALSYPMFMDYFIQAKRAEAKSELHQLALAMETFYIKQNTYSEVTLRDLNFSEMIAKKSYHLEIKLANQSDYVLTATPIGKQAEKDKECAVLSLRSNNQKGITGYGNVDHCWR